jgi:hypothetical protein
VNRRWRKCTSALRNSQLRWPRPVRRPRLMAFWIQVHRNLCQLWVVHGLCGIGPQWPVCTPKRHFP